MEESRLCLVTGGSKGIGRAVCLALLGRGHRVAFADIDDEKARELLAENGNRELFYYHCDVSDPDAVGKMHDGVSRDHGPVSILINNAGIQTHVPFLEMSLETWQRTIDINLTASFHTCRAFLPEMISAGWGRIINISSMSARRGSQDHVHYCASKAGLLGMTRALSLEAAKFGVTVNAICPGIVDTDIIQETMQKKRDIWLREMHVKRIGRPDDIANAVLFLASGESDWISGQAIDVNGGILTP